MEKGQSYIEKYKYLHIGSGIALLFWLVLTLFFMIAIQQSGIDNLDFYLMIARTIYIFQGISLSLMAVQIILMVFYDPLDGRDFVFGLGLALVLFFSIKDLMDGIYQFFVDPDLLLTMESSPVDQAFTTISMALAYVLLLGQVIILITSRSAKKKAQEKGKALDVKQKESPSNDGEEEEQKIDLEEESKDGEACQGESEPGDDGADLPKP